MNSRLAFILAACLLGAARLMADPDHCAICGIYLSGKVFIMTDKVTNEKKQLCYECSVLPQDCFICGLPVKADFVKLPDGRYLCARDAKGAILDDDEAKRVCEEVQAALDRHFARFIAFPATNVVTTVVDRVNLRELFKFPGNDYTCPNVLGYIQSKTNHGRIRHEISLLGALPRAEFKAVCAHEFTHAWEFENLSARRKKQLGHDANEGFCELVAYLLMDSQQEEDEMAAIRKNAYTRGQIDLFIEAEQRFGFNQIVEWMKYGVDAVLHRDDLNNVRNVVMPRPAAARPATNFPAYSAPPAPALFEVLTLKSVIWGKTHPLAIINNQTFEVGDELKVRLQATNVLVRCVAIREDSVRIKVAGAAEEQELRLPKR